MQLQILSILEERIGLGIPIREFFDLIIGTRYVLQPSRDFLYQLTCSIGSAGGIIALGLGERRMSIEECLEMFRTFSRKAFTRRIGTNIHGIRYLVEAQHHSQYESKGLNQSLKLSFGEKKMFGEAAETSNDAPKKPVKVGVTMTSSSGRPYLITNYNRATRKISTYFLSVLMK